MTFQQFLRSKHGEWYIGTDDDMPDDFDNWLTELDADDFVSFGEEYGKILISQIV